MCSCSRIALRCGDLEASRSGGAGGASATSACYPDLLCRPLVAPLGRDEVVVLRCIRARRCLHLDQVLDLEAVLPQQTDPVAVSEVVFGAVLLGPADAV